MARRPVPPRRVTGTTRWPGCQAPGPSRPRARARGRRRTPTNPAPRPSAMPPVPGQVVHDRGPAAGEAQHRGIPTAEVALGAGDSGGGQPQLVGGSRDAHGEEVDAAALMMVVASSLRTSRTSSTRQQAVLHQLLGDEVPRRRDARRRCHERGLGAPLRIVAMPAPGARCVCGPGPARGLDVRRGLEPTNYASAAQWYRRFRNGPRAAWGRGRAAPELRLPRSR